MILEYFKLKMKAIISAILSLSLFGMHCAQAMDSQFVLVKLPHGVQAELPKSWWVISKAFNAVIETSAEAALDLSESEPSTGSVENLIAANSMPRTTYASVRVDYLTPAVASPEEIGAFTPPELKELEGILESQTKSLLPKQGSELLNYLGTTLEKLDNHPTVIAHYRRAGPQGPVLVWVYQVFLPTATVNINLSYRESETGLWKPVIQRILSSFTFSTDTSSKNKNVSIAKEQKYELVVNNAKSFSAKYPSDWKPTKSLYSTTVLKVESPDGQDYGINVITDDKLNLTSADKIAAFLKKYEGNALFNSLKSQMPKATLVENGTTTLSNLPAIYNVIDFPVSASGVEFSMRLHTIVTVFRNRVYTLNFRCRPDEYSDFLKTIKLLSLFFQINTLTDQMKSMLNPEANQP